MALIGAVVLIGAWAAVVQLQARGPWLVLAAMAIVWIADTAAYFAGRAFGRRKLAPPISPGKTWEGVYGALAAVASTRSRWCRSRSAPATRPTSRALAVGCMGCRWRSAW